MDHQPLVSIIMNCYNGQAYLDEALKSVVNQTYKNWEIIFWDNCSTDNSSKIFKKFEDKRFKYFLSKKHTVLYEARNLAIEKISGDFRELTKERASPYFHQFPVFTSHNRRKGTELWKAEYVLKAMTTMETQFRTQKLDTY